MRVFPRGYGGKRRSPEEVKREGWRQHGVLVIDPNDERLSWPDRQLVREIGERLYGSKQQGEARNG